MENTIGHSALIELIRKLREDYQSGLSGCSPEKGEYHKIVGTLCLSAPVELIEAVGAVHLRLLSAKPEAELRGGRFLSSDACSFCKSILGSLDRGEVHVDAVLGATTCDQMRRNLEIITRDLGIPVFIFNSPRTAENPISRDFARREFLRLAEEVSSWAGTAVEPRRLSEAIRRRRELSERIKSLCGLNGAELPRMTGGEYLALIQLFETTAADYLEKHLPEIEKVVCERRSPWGKKPLRIALLGSCMGESDDQIVELIEESGRAAIVYDAVCTGSRALGDETPLPGDPYDALLSIHHDQVLCPFRLPHD